MNGQPKTDDGPEVIELSARVPAEEYYFFREHFPQYGAATWFITTALLEFNAQVRANPTTQEHIAKSIDAMVGLNRLLRDTGI